MSIATLCRRDVVTVGQHMSLAEAAQLMLDKHVGALVLTAEDSPGGTRVVGLVTDKRRELVGIVTLDDLVEALASQLSDLAASLREGSRREAAVHVPPPPDTDSPSLTGRAPRTPCSRRSWAP